VLCRGWRWMDQISDSVVDRSPATLTFLKNLQLFNVNMQFGVNEEASGAALNLGKAFFCICMGEWMWWMPVSSSFCISYVVMMCMRVRDLWEE